MDKVESKIMAEVAKGNLSAFREIVERYQNPLLNYIYRFTGDRAAAEDIAQEVFLRVFKTAKEYRPLASFKALRQKRLELNDLIFIEPPDMQAIEGKRRDISKLQAELEKEVIDHIVQEKELLTPEQKRRFYAVIQGEFEKGGLGVHGERQ
ncbi:MAG: sigma factor [Thermodesulfovibrionales bacterium]